MDRVDLSKVEKQLKKIPQEIVIRLMRWVRTVEEVTPHDYRTK